MPYLLNMVLTGKMFLINKTLDSSATIFKSFTIFNIYVIHLAVPCIKEKFMIPPSCTDKHTDQIFSTTHLSWRE